MKEIKTSELQPGDLFKVPELTRLLYVRSVKHITDVPEPYCVVRTGLDDNWGLPGSGTITSRHTEVVELYARNVEVPALDELIPDYEEYVLAYQTLGNKKVELEEQPKEQTKLMENKREILYGTYREITDTMLKNYEETQCQHDAKS